MYVSVCITVCVPCFCLQRWPENTDSLITLSVPDPNFFISKYHAPIKRSSLGEMADFRAGPEKVQYEPGTSCCAKKQESTQKNVGDMSEGHEPA